MKVNRSKIAMLCISGASSYKARSHIFDSEGEIVQSTTEMKILGYHLSLRPGAHAHVQALSKRMRRKY